MMLPDMGNVWEALDSWEASQVCIRSHVRIVREIVEQLDSEARRIEATLAEKDARIEELERLNRDLTRDFNAMLVSNSRAEARVRELEDWHVYKALGDRVRELEAALKDACEVAIWLSGLDCLRTNSTVWRTWEDLMRPKLFKAMDSRAVLSEPQDA